MIIVSVQLLSAVDGRRDELARMEICNMGTGTATMGNYSAETLRGRSAKDFARRTRQRIAYVSAHPRQREHVWNLVAKALRNLRYGGDWNTAEQVEVSGPTAITLTHPIPDHRDGPSHEEQMRKALEKARSWLEYDETPMGPAETRKFEELLKLIDDVLASPTSITAEKGGA